MPEPRISKTGNAPHLKQGHTTDGRFGSDPELKGRPAAAKVRDLVPK